MSDLIQQAKTRAAFSTEQDSDLLFDLASEITRLRAENERLREAVQLLISTQEKWERSVEKIIGKQPNIFLRAIDRARAALEGVTEPAR